MTPFKLTAGCTAIFALLFCFAVQRIPGTASQLSFDDTWEQTVIPAKKTDRLEMVTTEPKPVEVERIMPDTLRDVPPVASPPGEDKPLVGKHRRHGTNEARRGMVRLGPAGHGVARPGPARQGEARNICTRHGLQKVIIGRSWRCRN